ncbi:phosphoadenylyl-sulfate reductase [Kordiimonas sp. SCSIO 12610]|nr:phosphoadenylyl-sulfate reductase [Kordiimonas sp. SCSIO 12610]
MVAALNARFDGTAPEDIRPEAIIEAARDMLGDKFALVSSFGAESAVLLHLAAKVSKDIPVLFLDTGKLFGETKRYRDTLTEQLDLNSVITLTPDADDLETHDPKGILWNSNNNGCCYVRKVVPLNKALDGYYAWASGRKRFHGAGRAALPHFEASDNRVKVNPLAFWNKDQVSQYMKDHDLPAHPLVAEGFASIGCMPCTDRVADGADVRSGRWKGKGKTECGIHLTLGENAKLASYESSGL